MTDDAGIWTDLRGLADAVEPVFRGRVEADLDELRNAGITDFDHLLHLPNNPQAQLRARVVALWALSRLRDQRGVAAMLLALSDEAGHVRAAAAQALGDIGGEFAAAAVPDLETAVTDPEIRVRRAAVYALGMLGGESQVARLAAVLGDGSESPHVRGAAAEALADLGAAQGCSALSAALADPSAEVRYWAAFALGEIGTVSDLPALSSVAENDQGRSEAGEMVDEEAASAIVRIENRSTIHILGVLRDGDLLPRWPRLAEERLRMTASGVAERNGEYPSLAISDVPEGALVLVTGYPSNGKLHRATILAIFDVGATGSRRVEGR